MVKKSGSVPVPSHNAWGVPGPSVISIVPATPTYDPTQYYFSTRDEDGQSRQVQARFAELLVEMIGAVTYDSRTEFANVSDFLRDAAVHNLQRVVRLVGMPEYEERLKQLTAAIESKRLEEELDRWIAHKETFDKRAAKFHEAQSWGGLQKLLDKEATIIAGFPEPHRSNSLAVWTKYRNKLEEATRPTQGGTP